MELPDEIIELIASKLDCINIINFNMVNKQIHSVVSPYIKKELKSLSYNSMHVYKSEITLYIIEDVESNIGVYKIKSKDGKYHGVSTFTYVNDDDDIIESEFTYYDNGTFIKEISYFNNWIIFPNIIYFMDNIDIAKDLPEHEVRLLATSNEHSKYNGFNNYYLECIQSKMRNMKV